MVKTIIRWKFNKLVYLIVATLLNKYDFFMVIEGGTGIGKSTLAFHIGSRVAKEFRALYRLKPDRIEYYYERIGKKQGLSIEEFINKILKYKMENAYKFNPKSSLIYTQDELQRALAGWHGVHIPDEMINITFNRDFFSEKQKDIIKMLNMFRDHENLTIACVPLFQNLDTQIKNLTKMKITVKKRGLAIIHTPNKTIYCKDKWDQATNEKIEREWIMKKIIRPNYSKLTTFRGLIRFPPLSRRQEQLYQEIKNDKRAIVLKDEMHIEINENDTAFNKVFKKLIEGRVKNSAMFEGMAHGLGIGPKLLASKLRKKLIELNKPIEMSYYFYNKNKNKREELIYADGIQ